MIEIDWAKQHCGVILAPVRQVMELMPDLIPLIQTFPDDPMDFTWDVKVHMLMPRQYPCIPGWHRDFVPRVNGRLVDGGIFPEKPMYVWISGPPITQFHNGYAKAGEWHKFTQNDEHRGTQAADFCWRGFVRAVHKEIRRPNGYGFLRRHAQVYLDAGDFKW